MNRLAAIARKHDCPEVCKHIIATQYGFNAMEVQEAFVKIREQAQAYLEQPDQLVAGLNLLSSQNLDYFQTPHQVWSLTPFITLVLISILQISPHLHLVNLLAKAVLLVLTGNVCRQCAFQVWLKQDRGYQDIWLWTAG